MRVYSGQMLDETLITYKIDGVKAVRDPVSGKWLSRAGNPLYNIPELDPKWTEIEVYKDNWSQSISLCRTKNAPKIPEICCYNLNPVDSRLIVDIAATITPAQVDWHLERALSSSYEGLVLYPKDGEPLKVKQRLTFDLIIEDVFEGKGRNKGRLGGFITNMGKVGTGFSDRQRQEYWINPPIGKIIEIACMEVNEETRKARHPVFIRIREDLS